MVFCFFNLQCLAYDIPSLILHSELQLALPSGEESWRADSEASWILSRRQEAPGYITSFQAAMRTLLDDKNGGAQNTEQGQISPDDPCYSTFGSYVLINGLMQSNFELRRYSRSIPGSDRSLSPEHSKTLERALRKWQKGWENNPEASLNPRDPHGPLAFNCTALLRMAYIRLDIDFGPYSAALRSGDPQIVARTICNEPPAKRGRRSTRAALHACHALLIPIKMGIDLVAHTQVFLWSIQHFIASFECCLLLAKWLDAVTVGSPDPPLSEEERWLIRVVQETLQECNIHTVNDVRTLSSSVLTTWARLFHGNTIWGILPLMGTVLNMYAELLSSDLQRL